MPLNSRRISFTSNTQAKRDREREGVKREVIGEREKIREKREAVRLHS